MASAPYMLRRPATFGYGPSGLPPTSPPVTLDTGGGGAPAPAAPTNPFLGTNTTGSGMGGDAAQFLQALYSSRPSFIKQQGRLLQELGAPLRSAVLSASPELAQASDYLQRTFNDPFGGSRETFEDAIRGAQAARGFTGGGSGVVGEEARYLTNFAERRRQELLPQLQGFGNNMLQISGLAAPPDITLGAIGSLALQNRNQIDSKAAAEEQSRIAQQLFQQYMGGSGGAAAGNPFGSNGGAAGGGSSTGGGGSFSFSAGSNAGAGTYDASGNLISSGYGLEFGRGVDPAKAAAAKYQKAREMLASGQLRTERDYLNYIGQGDNRETVARDASGGFLQL